MLFLVGVRCEALQKIFIIDVAMTRNRFEFALLIQSILMILAQVRHLPLYFLFLQKFL